MKWYKLTYEHKGKHAKICVLAENILRAWEKAEATFELTGYERAMYTVKENTDLEAFQCGGNVIAIHRK